MLLGYHSGITTVYEGLQRFLRSIGKYLAHAVDPDAEEAIVDDGLEASAPIGTGEMSEDAAATSGSEASPGSAGEKQLFMDADGLNPRRGMDTSWRKSATLQSKQRSHRMML